MHWSLVVCVFMAWWWRHSNGPWHERFGYAALAIAGARLVWGWAGRGYARFGQFVRAPRITWAYARAVAAGQAPRYLGHNPLGGWMVVALLTCIGLLGCTGWLYNTDRFWGYAWLANLHAGLGWGLCALVGLHLAGVVFTSWRHRESLVTAMLTGRKAPPAGDDIA